MENNNQDIKLCPSCGARNKAVYNYCNECGAALNQNDYANSANTAQGGYANAGQQNQYSANGSYYGGQYTQNGYAGGYAPYGAYAPYMGVPDFDGVSAKDLYEFSGEKPQFFEKLKEQHFTGKNGPFCWPLFILGILLGFFGMGCWYLYHKMYKPAVAFFAVTAAQISVAAFFVIILLKDFTSVINSGYLDSALEKYAENTTEIPMELFSSIGINTLIMEGISNLISVTTLALTIALPFYAYKQYKKFAINKIRTEYQKGFQPNLRRKGGTNSGAVVLASVLYAITGIALLVTVVIGCVNFVLQNADNIPNGITLNEHYEHSPYSNDGFDFNDFLD